MSRTWIFQSNPKRFDIDGYLATNTGEVPWLVTTNAKNITIGDTAYLWRSGEDAGVIAEGEVVAPVLVGPDDPAALPYWTTPTDGSQLAPRTRVRLRKVGLDPRVAGHLGGFSTDAPVRARTGLPRVGGTRCPIGPLFPAVSSLK
jgi:hypothetical protein